MTVVIGFGTTITASLFPSGGITSVNWSHSAQVTRLWELGNFDPYDTFHQTQRSLSINAYGKKLDGTGGSSTFELTKSTACEDSTSTSITVTPGICQGAASPFTYSYFPSSYSYSKANPMDYGQESWSFVTKPNVPNYTGSIYILRGSSTGQVTAPSTDILTEAQMGVVVDEAASKDSNGNWISGETGSVSAGLSLGTFDEVREVVFSSIGGSTSKADGYRGNANVTVETQTIFV